MFLIHLIVFREIGVEKSFRSKPREATPGRYLGRPKHYPDSRSRRSNRNYSRSRSRSRDYYRSVSGAYYERSAARSRTRSRSPPRDRYSDYRNNRRFEDSHSNNYLGGNSSRNRRSIGSSHSRSRDRGRRSNSSGRHGNYGRQRSGSRDR